LISQHLNSHRNDTLKSALVETHNIHYLVCSLLQLNERALEDINKILELLGESEDKQLLASYYYLKGKKLNELRRYDDAKI
jgi:hypothetical protein